MSLKSPLGRVLGLGSAKDGAEHWWSQRISAVALAFLGLWFAAALISLDSYDYRTVRAFLEIPWNAVLTGLLLFTLLYHSHLGVQVVIEDYVHEEWIKVASLVAVKFAHVVAGALGIFAVLSVGFGA